MVLRICLDCTTGFAVGALRCPHCGSERHAEEGSAAALGVVASTSFREEPMPKISRHGGATNATPTGQGGDRPSAGNSSSTSTEKPLPTPETNASSPPKRARTTGSRSRKARTGNSTAGSTAGPGPETDTPAE